MAECYHRAMRSRFAPHPARRGVLAAAVLAACFAGACGTRLVKQYEYEEEMYLELDGSATVMVNASIPALVALRGLDLDTNPRAPVDRETIRSAYESGAARVMRVSRPWRRDGRRFVHVRLEIDDFRQLSRVGPFSWSGYTMEQRGNEVLYRQVLGASAARPVGDVGWDGSEVVAFRLHLPARIHEHNTPSRRVERGNILAWEQPLEQRLAGTPLTLDVRMENESILYTTLTLFGAAFAAAMILLAGVVWWVMRRGPSEAEEDEPRTEVA
jgi:hypothetical protein